jgi:hypothetical protein
LHFVAHDCTLCATGKLIFLVSFFLISAISFVVLPRFLFAFCGTLLHTLRRPYGI